MELIKCINIKKEYGDRVILTDVSFAINQGSRVAIVGDNGAGKTTLANIITGAIKHDGGTILWNGDKPEIGYLHQSSYYTQKEFQTMLHGDTEEIGDFFEISKKMGIGKIDNWEDNRLEGLSGGEKTKLALARIWSEKPQLLILDEPTNHLDFKGIQWLIKEIKKYPGTVILISHDRYFMDKTVKKIIEIEDGTASTYNGNYTAYKEEKRRRYESQLKEYQIQEKYKAKINSDIQQLSQWSDKAHRESTNKVGFKEYWRMKAKKKDKQIKSRIKRLEKIDLEGVKKPKEEQNITFNFISDERCGNRILQGESLSKSYGPNLLFKDSSFYIKRGECVALFGDNGCGKTTLIKGILKETSFDEGDIYLSTSAKVAYLSQDVMNLDGDKTVLQFFGIENYEKRGMLQTLLTNMGFSKSMVHKKINTLSLGERTRVKVAHMIVMENNVLVLDEPTNHLDLHSREMLETTLSQYEGTILLVSHDRYLLEKLCDKVLAFEDGCINRYEYSFKEYLHRKENPVEMPKSKKDDKKKNLQKELMIIENRIAAILGEFSTVPMGSPRYKELDEEFKKLIAEKNKVKTSWF